MPDTRSSLSLLEDQTFRRLWSAVQMSFLGMFIHVVACGWILASMGASAMHVALLQTAYSLPLVLFSIVAGAMADTFDRRRSMLFALGLSLTASLGLTVAALGPWQPSPWVILWLIFAVGTGAAFFNPPWQASLGDLVPRSRLSDAVSLQNVGANLMRTVGPTVGGLLLAGAGAGVTFVVGALSYVPASIAIFRWRPAAQHPSADRERLVAAMGAAVHFLAASPALWPALLRSLAYGVSAVSVLALLPLIAREQLGAGASVYGLLFGSYGLGAILGGLSLPHWRQRFGLEITARWVYVLNAVSVALLPIAPAAWVVFVATTMAGACWLISLTIHNSVLQQATPRWMVGRVVAMYYTAAYLGLSIGGWLWGWLAEVTSTRWALALSALALLGTARLSRRLRLPAVERLMLEPAADAGTVEQPPDLNAETGPLVVMIEHKIDPANVAEFRRLMLERQLHLTRLGARQWTLVRDVRDPGWWSESFRVRTWGDYRRLMSRRTAETVALRQAVNALQRDGQLPLIRLLLVNPDTERMPVPTLPA